MLVFIDESGDAGFRLDSGSSRIFAAVMVIFEDADQAAGVEQLIVGSEVRKHHKGEFKFVSCRDDIKDRYFQLIANAHFQIRAIVVDKEKIHSPYLRVNKDKFYNYFIKNMMKDSSTLLRDAKIKIDGSGDREFKKNLNQYLMREVGKPHIKSVKFSKSDNDSLIQLADMCVGAIARAYRNDGRRDDRWRRMLARRIENIWEFR